MNRCEQVEFDIDEMKDDIAIQQFELVAMKHSMDELELKIEQLVDNDDIVMSNEAYGRSDGLSELVQSYIKRTNNE